MLTQTKVIEQLDAAISKEGITYVINPTDTRRFERQTVSLDVEHDESGGFVGCGIWSGSGPICYFNSISVLNGVPFDSLAIVAHNGISDIECLQIWGINVSLRQLVHDTMLIGHIIDSSLKSYSLKDMAKRECGINYPSYDDIVGKRGLKAERITLDKQPLELVAKYNALDVYSTYKLYERQRKAVNV